ALVGAVDFGCEPVHRRASASPPGDAAIALVLKRLDDARRDGDRIHAVFGAAADGDVDDPSATRFGADGIDLSTLFGEPFAARGLLHVAAAALCIDAGRGVGSDARMSAA